MTPLKHRARLLRWLVYALGGLLVLGFLGWALVRCESWSQTVPRSDGTLAMVQTYEFRWRKWSLPKMPASGPGDPFAPPSINVGGEFIGTLVLISDDQGTFSWWTADARELPCLVLDLDGGYVLATTKRQGPSTGTRGYWLGPQRQRTNGLPPHLPLRRCVQNIGLNGLDQIILSDFEPESLDTIISPTAGVWWQLRGKAPATDEAVEKVVREILATEFGGERDLLKALSQAQMGAKPSHDTP